MPEAKKSTTAVKTPVPASVDPVSAPAEKAAEGIFAKIQASTGLSHEKIDAWQAKWLAMPETRTKYQSIQDVPGVVGDEMLAMSNDIIDFIQGQPGGKSVVFPKVAALSQQLFDKGKAYLAAKWKTMSENAKPDAPAKDKVEPEKSQGGSPPGTGGGGGGTPTAPEAEKPIKKAKAPVVKAKAPVAPAKKAKKTA